MAALHRIRNKKAAMCGCVGGQLMTLIRMSDLANGLTPWDFKFYFYFEIYLLLKSYSKYTRI